MAKSTATLSPLDQQRKAEEACFAKMNDAFGDKIFKASDLHKHQVPSIPFPSPALNDAVHFWGIPLGKITQFYGSEGCLAGDTSLDYVLSFADGSFKGVESGTIERLYQQFHRPGTKGKISYTTDSINEDGGVIQNRIADVVKTGTKECFRVRAGGRGIEATTDHKFWTGYQFLTLGELKVGDQVHIHNDSPFAAGNTNLSILVKNHGVAESTIVQEEKYYRLRRSRAVMEACLNGLTYGQYVERLNSGDLNRLHFLPREMHVHHIDENIANDDLDNLALIKNLPPQDPRFQSVPVTIESIEPVGLRETYDIKMESPYNNYVANGFVVHNCGKTLMAMLTVAQFQKHYPNALAIWVDAEHSFDHLWAQQVGVNTDRVRVIREDNAAEAFSILCGVPGKVTKAGILDMVAAGIIDVKIIVIDSIAALVPPVEETRTMQDQDIAALARFLPKAFRVLNSKGAKSGVATLCINQAREKIGEMVPMLSYPGGRAYRHMLSLNIKMVASRAAGNVLLDDNQKPRGHKVIATVEKTRGGPSNHKAEFWLDFYKGIIKTGEEVALVGMAYGVVDRATSASSLHFGEHSARTTMAFGEYLDQNPTIAEQILAKVKEAKAQGVRREKALSEDSAEDQSVTIYQTDEAEDPEDVKAIEESEEE